MFTPIFILMAVYCSSAIQPPQINLPEEIARVSHLRFHGDHLFILSQADKTLYKVEQRTGRLVGSYSRTGQGPGEWSRVVFFQIDQGLIYLSDTDQFKMIVVDLELNFVKELKGLNTEQFVIQNQNIFAVDYDFKEHAMIQQVKLDLTPIRQFGEPLTPEFDYEPVQIGLITAWKDLVYYMPYAWFEIRVFNGSGKRIETIKPPFWDPDFTKDCDLKNPHWNNDCKYSHISRLQSDGHGFLYISVRSYKTRQSISMRYHVKNGTWEGGIPSNWQLDPNTGQLYLLEENEDETLRLKLYEGVFKKFPG